MNLAPSFPTTQVIDMDTPIVDLIRVPVKAVYHSRRKMLELFKAMSEAIPHLSLNDFARAYDVPQVTCDFIRSSMEVTQ